MIGRILRAAPGHFAAALQRDERTLPVQNFAALDGLRGAAAIAVLMTHAAALFHPVWMRSAYLAVDLFFVLSGFVLAHAYGARLRRPGAVAPFMRIRLIRILPLYLLGTAIACATALTQRALGHGAWSAWPLLRSTLAAAALIPLPPVPGTPNGFIFPLNIPAWSLLFELLVNLLYAVIAPRLTIRRTAWIAGLALPTLMLTVWHFGGLVCGADWPSLWAGGVRVIWGFFAGVLAYHLAAGIPARHRFHPALMLPLLLLVFYVPVPHALRAVFDFGCAAAVFPGLIVYAATARCDDRARRVCGLLGGLSYAVYALHVPLLGIAESLLGDTGRGSGWAAPGSGLLFLAVVAAMASAADRWYDRPVQRALRRRFQSAGVSSTRPAGLRPGIAAAKPAP